MDKENNTGGIHKRSAAEQIAKAITAHFPFGSDIGKFQAVELGDAALLRKAIMEVEVYKIPDANSGEPATTGLPFKELRLVKLLEPTKTIEYLDKFSFANGDRIRSGVIKYWHAVAATACLDLPEVEDRS